MNTRKLTSRTIDGYLKLLRLPADLVVRALPGQRTGPGPAARVVVDRVDAAVRAGVANTIGDDTLVVDARRRQAAADERARAIRLREQAAEREAEAESRVEQSHEQATQRRRRAASQATNRRKSAGEKQQSRSRQAAETGRKRTQASRKQEQENEERIERETARERLPAVEDQAEALEERQEAELRLKDAERLGETAARVKAERKEE